MSTDTCVQKLKIETHNDSYPPVEMRLLGTFQQENCATAVAALEYISAAINCELDIVGGLEGARWPSRFELIRETPPVILDGAHNPSAALALVKSLKEVYPTHEVGFLLGFMSDKDIGGILKPIASLAKKTWMVQLSGERALDLKGLKLQADLAGMKADAGALEELFPEAIAWANGSERRMLCICGSLFWRNELTKLDLL
jgi:dihydrofolate synthase/folylpolyglutamate synthase